MKLRSQTTRRATNTATPSPKWLTLATSNLRGGHGEIRSRIALVARALSDPQQTDAEVRRALRDRDQYLAKWKDFAPNLEPLMAHGIASSWLGPMHRSPLEMIGSGLGDDGQTERIRRLASDLHDALLDPRLNPPTRRRGPVDAAVMFRAPLDELFARLRRRHGWSIASCARLVLEAPTWPRAPITRADIGGRDGAEELDVRDMAKLIGRWAKTNPDPPALLWPLVDDALAFASVVELEAKPGPEARVVNQGRTRGDVKRKAV